MRMLQVRVRVLVALFGKLPECIHQKMLKSVLLVTAKVEKRQLMNALPILMNFACLLEKGYQVSLVWHQYTHIGTQGHSWIFCRVANLEIRPQTPMYRVY